MDIFTRRLPLSPTTLNEANRTVSVILVSKDNAVQRRDASGRTFTEKLATAPGSFALHSGDRIPLLDTHNGSSIDNIRGFVSDIRVEDGAVVGTATITEDRAFGLVKAGALTGISIGYKVAPNDWQAAGDTRTAVKYVIAEASLCASPADSGATLRSDNPMPDPQPGALAETNRQIRSLTATAGLPAAFADNLIDRQASVDEARSAILTEMQTRNVRFGPAMQIGPSGDDPAVLRQRMAEGLSFRMGRPGVPPAEAREYANGGLHLAMRDLLAAAGVAGAHRMPAEEMITRSLATTDFSALLTDTTRRILQPAYVAAQSPVRQRLMRASTAADFRDLHRVRISEAPALEAVPEGGAITQGAMSEADESYRVATYGRILSLTFQAIQNDDLGAFGRNAVAMGQAAGETENNLVLDLLLSGAGAGPTMSDTHALFDHTNHGNAAASGGAIADTTVEAAVLAMRTQKGLDGSTPIVVNPAFMLVSAAKEFLARQTLGTIYPQTTADVNPLAGILDVLVEPRLDARSVPNPWYVFASPDAAPVLEYAYLTGAEGPQIDSRSGWEVLGVETRVVLHFGAGVVDYRGAYRNAGA
jgi:phage head maturation protease